MFFKKINILFLLGVGLGCSSFHCNKRFDCSESLYTFSISTKAFPDKDSINIGDTIWLELNEPTTLNDLGTGRMIDYSGAANLGSAIGFQKLSNATGNFTIDAVQKFNFSLIQGVEVNNRAPTLYKEYIFGEANNRYIFKLGVIPRESGIYSLVFSNATGVYLKRDNCTKASFGINFKNTNQHYYLNPNFQGGPIPVGGDYYFKVY